MKKDLTKQFNQKTVTIGIPAYNEEQNIKAILDALLLQREDAFRITKILVYSDHSEDTTNLIVSNMANPKIELIIGETRLGMMGVENEIFNLVHTDILVMLNADTLPKDTSFISSLVAPLLNSDRVGLTSCLVTPLQSKSFFENVLNFSHKLKTYMYEHVSSTFDSIYLCHGRARAFTKDLYKNFKFPNVMAEDAYSYLVCKSLSLEFKYVNNTEILFRSPSTLPDYLRQSIRFHNSVDELIQLFPSMNVRAYFKIPFSTVLKSTIKYFFLNPAYLITYFGLLLLSRFFSLSRIVKSSHLWEAIKSSKSLIVPISSTTRRKRIDVIVEYFYPVAAGIETNVLQTYKVLVKNGWDVCIHTKRDSLTERNIYEPSSIIEGLTVRRYTSNFWGFFPTINYDETDLIALHNFNIFPHLNIFFTTLLRKLFGKKKYVLFLTPHGGYNPEWNVFSPLLRVLKWIFHHTLGYFMIVTCVDGIRAVSEWEKVELVKKGIAKKLITVIPNGLEDCAYLDIELLAGEKIRSFVSGLGRYIVQIGRIFPIKNYETSIRSLVLLPADVKLVIVGPVGSDSYNEKLKGLVEILGLKDRVIFYGVIRDIDKYYLLKHAQVMVHMAIWESYCNVVREALSQGIICIVANNTALPYLVKDQVNGFCIPTNNSSILAEKINYVLEHTTSKQIMEIRKVNSVYGKENSWTNTATLMEVVYSRLIKDLHDHVQTYKPVLAKLFRLLPMFLFIISISSILFINIRGYLGNPTINDLNTSTWKENGPFELSPERGRYALTYSYIEDSSFYFSKDVAKFATPDLGMKNGRYVSLFAPGVSFVMMPGYILGKYFNMSQVGATSVVTLFSIFNALLVIGICTRLGLSRNKGFLAALVFLFATPAFSYALSIYQHHLSVFIILGCIYLFLSKRTLLNSALFWFLVACSLPVDYPNLFFLLPVILPMFLDTFNIKINSLAISATIKYLFILTLFSAFIPFAFFLWFNKNSYDNYFQLASTVTGVTAVDDNGAPRVPKKVNFEDVSSFVTPQEKQRSATNFFKTRNTLNGLYIFSISPDRGTLVYTPVVLLGFIGLYFLYLSNPKISSILMGIVFMNILLYSMRSDVWGGWAFGSRYLIPTYAILSVGVSILFSRLLTLRSLLICLALFMPLFGYSVYVNTLGALTTNAIPPQVEVLKLEELSGIEEKYSYNRNIDHINSGNIKSVGFNTFFNKYFDSWQYFTLVVLVVLVIGATILFGILREWRYRK